MYNVCRPILPKLPTNVVHNLLQEIQILTAENETFVGIND